MSDIYLGSYWYGIPIDVETAVCMVVVSCSALYLAGANYALKVANHKYPTYTPKHQRGHTR